MPRIGNPDSRLIRNESANPTGPKSMPWLLAMVTTSTPAAFTASMAWAGTWNVNFLGWGLPPVPSAASRLSMVTSAADSVGAMADRTVPGEERSAPSWLLKLVSPAKARVTAWPLPVGGRVVVVVVASVSLLAPVSLIASASPERSLPGVLPATDDSSVPAHAAAASATAPTTSSPRTVRWSRRGRIGPRYRAVRPCRATRSACENDAPRA